MEPLALFESCDEDEVMEIESLDEDPQIVSHDDVVEESEYKFAGPVRSFSCQSGGVVYDGWSPFRCMEDVFNKAYYRSQNEGNKKVDVNRVPLAVQSPKASHHSYRHKQTCQGHRVTNQVQVLDPGQMVHERIHGLSFVQAISKVRPCLIEARMNVPLSIG